MRNSSNLEAGNKSQASSHQISDVVYGYPVGRPATSYADYLLWTRTTSSSSSSSSLDVEAAAAPPVNHRGKTLRDKVLFWSIISFLLTAIVLCSIGEAINTHNYPKFQVDSITFSPFNNGSGSANWTVGVLVRNTNRYTRMAYDDFQVSVYYKEEQLSTAAAMVSPLYLGPKNQTSVVASLEGRSLGEKNLTAAEIEEDRMHGGVVNFDVVLEVKMTYFFLFPEIGGRKKVLKTELLCLDVQVGFSSNATEQGSMVGGPYRCYSPLDVILGLLLSSKS